MRLRLLTALLLSLYLIGCKPDQKKEGIVITATTGMIHDGLANLLPADVKIQSLMGPGIDPHLYKPTSNDLAKLKEADIIVYNGLSLEGKMEEILKNLSKKKPTLAVGDFVDETQLINSNSFSGLYDPHFWFDVSLWNEGLNALSDSIFSLYSWDPERSANPDYSKELMELNSWISAQVASIPEEKRILITAHDAFGYFGKAYGIEVMGLQGISTLSEAGLKDIDILTDFIIEKEIKSVFIESIINPKAIEAVIQGCKLKGYDVKLGGTLFSDALGPRGTQEDTYIGMVRYNVTTITNAIR